MKQFSYIIKCSFLETAESLQLDGPSDWSENLDKYLYGEEKEHEP